MNVLVINSGSSSLKYAVFDANTEALRVRGKAERIGQGRSYDDAIDEALAAARDYRIDAVGHRVVHGGESFSDAVRIDEAVLSAIESLIPLAPLHNPANAKGIEAARKALPDVPHVAVFDTAFHSRLPRRARTYAIDAALAERHGIRRYGFHGTSHAYVAGKAAEHLGRPLGELRIVSLHLGNGASACAVEFGHSTETSMGMTPLEGLVMGTRVGDIDPGVVLKLMRDEQLDVDGADRLLNERSGLSGLSGAGNDVRDIEARAAEGDDQARLAIAVFCHRAKKYIGAYAATMAGLDAVVLTGGIGENSATFRRRILQRLDFLGLVLDEEKNAAARATDDEPVIDLCAPYSRVRALAVRTNEELMIARQAAAVAGRRTEVKHPGSIPIAISARHIHLNQETFAKLFGADATPTREKDISQPGQYACAQKVNLVGPRGRIDGVRLLGPLRSKNQVEISRTDEFELGVDAPIRDSGHTEASAPIVVEGPEGRVSLDEGLICARRHIHMTPGDAERFGVEDGDEVEVAVTGGPRDLVFGDVLIRVSPKYKLEMHIDTDEANAAELGRGAEGGLVYSTVLDAGAELDRRRA